MFGISAPAPPVNQWNHNYIRPGDVHPVGTTYTNLELKKTEPNLRDRYLYKSTTNHGTYAKDGFINAGRVIDLNWHNPTPRKIKYGEVIHSSTCNDLTAEPFLMSLGNPQWADTEARIYNSLSDGATHGPAPGGFTLPAGEYPRGGNYPRIIGFESAEAPLADPQQQHDRRRGLIQ